MNEKNNPFLEMSNLFIENQRQFNIKTDNLTKRLNHMISVLTTLKTEINQDVFSANLVGIMNIEQEASLMLDSAKELEFKRDQINNSLALLKDIKKIKLNK